MLHKGFADFLDRYGHRGVYETYTRNPRWREEPGYLLDNLLALANTDLEMMQERNRQSYEQAHSRVVQALPFGKREQQ